MGKQEDRHRLPDRNPFEASGSGSPLDEGGFWLPTSWNDAVAKKLEDLNSNSDRRALAVVGEYGSGKSYVLKWLEKVGLPRLRIRAYYFENPEVKFYDLANSLLRNIGRKHFAKLVFELAAPYMQGEQRTLFSTGFDAFLEKHPVKAPMHVVSDLRDAITRVGITDDEEIVDCLARIVAETGKKPYFEYRDFVTSKKGSYVAEKQEPKYFNAILEVMRRADGIERIAFLLDEFEQVSLQHRLTRKDAQDYLATLKRLLAVTQEGDLWIVVAMTPNAWETTNSLDPAFRDRCYEFAVPSLTRSDAEALIRQRFSHQRKGLEPPFEAGFINALRPTTVANPRRLVKVFYVATNEVMRSSIPVNNSRLAEIEDELYPLGA